MKLCEGKYGGKVVRLQRGAHGDLLVIVGVTSWRAPRSSVFMCSAAHVNSGDLFVFDHRGLWVCPTNGLECTRGGLHGCLYLRVLLRVLLLVVEGSKIVGVYVFDHK